MWHLIASAYGEDVYNNSEVYAASTEAIADSGAGAAGGLADTGMYAIAFIAIGLIIITVTVLAQHRRRQSVFAVK